MKWSESISIQEKSFKPSRVLKAYCWPGLPQFHLGSMCRLFPEGRPLAEKKFNRKECKRDISQGKRISIKVTVRSMKSMEPENDRQRGKNDGQK